MSEGLHTSLLLNLFLPEGKPGQVIDGVVNYVNAIH